MRSQPWISGVVAVATAVALGLPAISAGAAVSCAGPPTPATGATLHIGRTVVTVSGTVDERGCSTTYRFEYGATTAYGSVSVPHAAPATAGAVRISGALRGLTPGTEYHYALLATSSGGTATGADMTFTTAPAAPACSAGNAGAPVASTGSATEVRATTARLQATIDPDHCPTTYRFEYGTTTAYGSVTATRTVDGIAPPTVVGAPLTDLLPNTTYHYRIDAASGAGTADGADMTFTTGASCAAGADAAPAVTEAPAEAITAAHVLLTGTVDPNGCATRYEFAYGPTTAYGSVTMARAAGSGTDAVPVRALLSGLPAGAQYHFRLVATSAAGTTTGPDLTFTTHPACTANASPRPLVRTTAAVTVTMARATLTGAVVPNGCVTEYQFQYGPTTAYGRATVGGMLRANAGSVAVRRVIAGLVPGHSYHFRLLATSAAGTTFGDDVSFTARRPRTRASRVRLGGGLIVVRRGRVAEVRLVCGGGTRRCRGVVMVFSARELIGRARFSLRAHARERVAVRLTRLGEVLARNEHRAAVVVVITGRHRLRRLARLTGG